MTQKYHDKDWLMEKYWEEELEQEEIADICGVDDSTICRWMNKLEVPTTFPEWVSREELERLYWGKLMSTRDIAELYGVSCDTVRKGLRHNNVEVRDRLEYQKYRAMKFHTHGGYEVWLEQSHGENKHFTVHRLLAIAEYGIDAVKGMDVHHDNELKWDNRPENLELRTPEDHARYHAKKKEMWKKSPR